MPTMRGSNEIMQTRLRIHTQKEKTTCRLLPKGQNEKQAGMVRFPDVVFDKTTDMLHGRLGSSTCWRRNY